MKKNFILFFSVIMLLIPTSIFADSTIKLWINGSYISSDVNPVIENSRTLVPIRVISEHLGYEVIWDEETKSVGIYKPEDMTAIIGGDTDKLLTLTVGNNKVIRSIDESLKSNELFYTLDVPPKIVNGRTYVPLRFIAEYFKLKVDWDSQSRTVIIGDGYKAPLKSEATKNKTANDIALELKANGIPIDKIIIYDKTSDVNNLLGKPGQYTSKVNFSIKGLEQYDINDPNGGSIEVFKNNDDAIKRKNKIINTIKNDTTLSTYNYTEYLYVKDNVLLRLHSDNFGNEDNYKEIFMKLK